MEKCYTCEKGNLVKKKVDYDYLGEHMGKFDAEVCDKCGEIFFDEKASDEIEKIVKERGLYGLNARTKIGKVGSSLDVKINKKIAEFMNIKKGEIVNVYPENKKRLIVSL